MIFITRSAYFHSVSFSARSFQNSNETYAVKESQLSLSEEKKSFLFQCVIHTRQMLIVSQSRKWLFRLLQYIREETVRT